MAEKFAALGYTLHCAGDIPGFYADIETGKPGPKLCIMGELDALDIANHPESVNGMAHCCGHHAQGAALLGVARRAPGAGRARGALRRHPADGCARGRNDPIAFREELRKKGVIHYLGGKVEFLYRGYFDGVNLALMVHGGNCGKNIDFSCDLGSNGCLAKTIRYKGKSAHAGGAPQNGVNAQYAAMLGLQACNALRETFPDGDSIRFHPIMMGVNCAVNIIPDEMRIESYVRARSIEAIVRENKNVNRALAGGALAMGAGVELHDRPGYFPEYHDPAYMKLVEQCCRDLVGAEHVSFSPTGWTTGSSDFGDLTAVMPGVQFTATGAAGTGHGIDYHVADADRLCCNSAKAQLFVADALLSDGAKRAQEIIAGYQPKYPSIQAYFAAVDAMFLDKDAVQYDANGNATLDYQNC